ncbi:GTP-binding protein [Ancylomarina euxinus]|uniref:Tetracycline resistance protein TetQ n=1 Tax=Ancylomarina euxinus TaxID=2283627 RepID=A0A425Y852_9BACT|nr:TetM/TetW/TetO/TetS family tetracycline resistance ribosomal protection protein [Ancylomarina euxinus]MCZ4693466.1 TetM/TetW/TetO/TetS family tetracycline resistance ribosomal protection protein [Ancylomarina euxinus]MUP13693.1 GTP-binding protein [Ancylomarina euxinus]RRG24666.1 GTP-binding protein [Ancylomarina euxinus]
MQNIRNIAVLAHVDAGKTTITENLLFLGGATRKMGSVDTGSAITDSLQVEKERGISVRSACTSFIWENTQINLIDTPGHVDFSAEVERVLRVLDAAILVVSAVEGVQAHTHTLYEALCERGIPVLIFINKIDRPGADVLQVFKDLQKELKTPVFALQTCSDEASNEAIIQHLWTNETNELGDDLKELSLEVLANTDEEVLEKYLEGDVLDPSYCLSKAQNLCKQSKLNPVLLGVAKNGLGMPELLDAIVNYFPEVSIESESEPSALVFKIEHDKTLGRLAHIRMFAGSLKNRDSIRNVVANRDEKVSLIRKIYTNKHIDIGALEAGDIGLVSGMPEVQVGDILGSKNGVPENTTLQIPLLIVGIKSKNEADYAKLAEALQELSSEDPLLQFEWFKKDREMNLHIMGTIQMEILEMLLYSRFGVEVSFDEPTVVYKETPARETEAYIRYTMPKPCWAVARFKIEPGVRGSGVTYKSIVGVNDVLQKYQNEIKRTIPKALEQGIKGWEVTDIKITLIEGEDHEMHSRPGDFMIATPMGLMKGLLEADTNLLEPILKFKISAPEEFLGKIAGELNQMRAVFANPEFDDGKFHLEGEVPAATSMDFNIRLSSLTGGKGKVKFGFSCYQDCPGGEEKQREYKGVNPLDESQWILHARGAFKTNEWRL